MKKIFTLAAAVLASFSLWAGLPLADIPEGTTAFSSESDWGTSLDKNKVIFDNNNYFMMLSQGNPLKIDEANGIKIGNSSKPSAFVFHLGTTADLKLIVGQNGSTSTVSLLYLGEEAEELTADNIADGTLLSSVEVSTDASPLELSSTACAPGYYKVHGSLRFCFKSIDVVTAALATDPVGTVSIDGPKAINVGEKASYTATTDVKANAYKWFVNEAEQEGASAAKFDFTPEATGTYAIACLAKNDNNADWVESNTISLVVSVKSVLEQVSISESTTWDWNNAASVDEIKLTAETSPAKNERCLLANLEGMNNDANFNSQALIFEGEYAMRIQSNKKMAQGQLLGFNTTVAGYLAVEYSNTGNRSAAEGETEGQESERRFITVNGNLIDSDAGSMKSGETVTVSNIPVAAGDVLISALRPYYTDHTTEPQYVRFYKVVFTKSEGDVPSAITNTEAAVKAVKRIVNGQFFIEKNGVLYNAQGAVVK